MLKTDKDPALLREERRRRPDRSMDFRDAIYKTMTEKSVALDLPIGIFVPENNFDTIAAETTVESDAVHPWDKFDVGQRILQKIVYPPSRSGKIDDRDLGFGFDSSATLHEVALKNLAPRRDPQELS
jgi:hypothetical protein